MLSRKTSSLFVYLHSLLALVSGFLVLWVIHISVKSILHNHNSAVYEKTYGVTLTHGMVFLLGFVSLSYAFLAVRESRVLLKSHLYDTSVLTASRYTMTSLCLNPAVLLVLFRFLIA